ncbi:MAG: EAL domain-containing protein, partial [Mycobacteriales bacterium]
KRGELSLVYQPIYRLEDASLAGGEAFCRWRHPLHGEVPPSEFLPLAKELSLIGPIGAWVMSTAIRQLSHWHTSGLPLPQLYVSIAAHELDGPLPDAVLEAFGGTHVPPGLLTLEITEHRLPELRALPEHRLPELRALPEHRLPELGLPELRLPELRTPELRTPELRTHPALNRLRAAGVQIASGDFGPGFSGLAQLPVQTLKLDRELIRRSTTAEGERLLRAVLGLAKDLGLATLAEGVEQAAQAAVLASAGCELAQGYHFGGPVPAESFAGLLAGRQFSGRKANARPGVD